MGSFLDKVGLQHFVEKVKNLLNGYLPLSGGTMTGAIKYTDKVTLNETELKFGKGNDLVQTAFDQGGVKLKIKKVGTLIKPQEINVSSQGFTIDQKDGTEIVAKANLSLAGCTTKMFTLTKKDKDDNGLGTEQVGLIANNSETVVKELSDEQIDKLLTGDTSTISDSKYYVSGANLGRFAQNVAKDKSYTIIYAEGGNVEVTTSAGEVTIEPGINCRIDGNYEITSGKENVSTIVQSGPIQDGNTPFINMEGLKGINVSRLDTSNVTSMAAYFARCASLPNFGLFYRDLAYWDTRKVTTFESMFLGCESVTSIQGINVWDTRNVNNMDSVFAACNKLTSLDLSGWSTQSVYSMDAMFDHCSAITTLTLSEGFGRMQNEVGTLNLSALTKWTNASVQTLEDLYDRKANGLGVITIKLSSATKNALGTAGINTLTTKGYTVA